jgi:beta-lactamase regulating signal transducer with metallopeptidase domain/peroxiredoxin
MSEFVSGMNSAGGAFVAFAVRMLIQSSVLILILLILDRLLRKRVRAVVRYWIWMLVLVKLLLPPSLSSPTSLAWWLGDKLPQTPLATVDAPPEPREEVLLSSPPALETMPREIAMTQTAIDPATSPAAPISDRVNPATVPAPVAPTWQALVLAGWLIVVAVMLAILAQRALFVRRLVAQSQDASERMLSLLDRCRRQMRVRTPVRLRVTSVSASPSVCGLVRPTILIPQGMLIHLDSGQWKSILLHELAHVRRADLWVNLAQTLLQIAYVYNPLLWLANATIRKVREQAVDETVLAAMGDEAEEYPRTLLNISKLAFGRPNLTLRLIGVVESKRTLIARIRHITSRPFPTTATLGVAGFVLVLVVGAALLPMAKAEPQEKTAGEPAATAQAAEAPVTQAASVVGSPEANPQAAPADAARTVEGIVTDSLGRPRRNVCIAPSGMDPWEGTSSDAQGRFALKDVPPGRTLGVAWSQPMNAMALFTIPEGRIDEPVHVALVCSDASVEGRVVGPDGAGLAGRKVEFLVETGDGLTYVTRAQQETDQFGNYSHGLIPCRTGLTVQARLADAGEAERQYVTKPVALSDGQIFVAMPRLVIGEGQPPETDDGKALLQGRVVNERREAIDGAHVRLTFDMPGWMAMWVKATQTDREGRWQMRVPKEHANLRIELNHPDYLGHHFDQSSEKPAKQELLDGTYVRVMKSGVRIVGVVKNEQGRPIENALVTAGQFYSWSPDGEVTEDCTTARTLADGTFSIGGLPEEQLDMLISATGYGPRLTPVEIRKNMPRVEATLSTGRTYTGQVVDANDRPVEGARVTLDGWRVATREQRLMQIATTDAQGCFRMTDLPNEGTLECRFGKRSSGLMGFSKEIPADLSQTDTVVMYRVPVFIGRVIDDETQKPVAKFTVVSGIRRSGPNEKPYWSAYYDKQFDAADGTFTYTWSGFAVTHPFTGDARLKIQAKGYLAEEAPPLKLGQECKPFVVRLTRAESRAGIVTTAQGKPAGDAEVGWVGPDERAYLMDGRFDIRGLSDQARQIVKTSADGRFELDRTRDEGLIVVAHPEGYAFVKSTEFTNGSKIALVSWARIEGTIPSAGRDGEQLAVAMEQPISTEESRGNRVQWMFDEVSITSDRFVIDHIPAIPLYLGTIIHWELSDPVYLNPEPGETYPIELGAKGRPVTGRIVHPAPGAKMGMSDPRQLHAVAFRIDPEPPIPPEITGITRASFQWLWRDSHAAYDRSTTFQKRFVPEVAEDGTFTFAPLAPGTYEFVVNYHAPLGENVSCGRGVLQAVAVSRFTVPDGKAATAVSAPDVHLGLLTYPKASEPAPLFEAKTFDGDTIRLADFRGKVVLLDFWATWCRPCVAQLPQMQQLHEEFKADDRFVMIGMSLDWDLEKARGFLAEKQLKWPQASLGNMDTSTIVKQYGVGSIPETILIDPQGKILAMGGEMDELRQKVRQALSDGARD